MGVFSFIGRMFGSQKSLDTMVTGLSSGLDKLVYTDEEKADAAAIDRANARSMLIEWMDKTQGQNIVRRMLATIIAFTWLSQYFITGLLNFLAVWKEDPDVVKKLHLAAKVTQENVDGMTGAMMLILGFYFAAPHLDKILGPAMARFAGKPNGNAT